MKYIISFLLKNVPRKYLQLFSHYVLKVLSPFYFGNQVECPVCGHRYRKFMPYGRVSRPNALCPSCLSLERHRLMWLYLKMKTNFFTESLKVLHVAPEICFLYHFRKMTNLDYITADLESPLAKIKMDVHHIPFEDQTFDVAFCNHVMEHVDDDIQSMKELYRVLKPRGWAIIQVPFYHPIPDTTFEDPSIVDPKEREKLFGQDDHIRKYGRDYPRRLENGGFIVTEEKLAKELDPDLVKRHALPAEEIIYFCRKG